MNNDTNHKWTGYASLHHLSFCCCCFRCDQGDHLCHAPAPPSCSAPATTLAQCSEEDEVVLVDDGGEQLQGDLATHRQLLQTPVQRLDSEG